MAKKIYNVTFADGTTAEYTSKKAIKALEGIEAVTVNGEDITNEFKEVEVMANETIITEENEFVEAIEAIEAVEEAQAEVEAIETPNVDTYLYVKAARDGSRLYWDVITVEGFQMGMTFKEIEALIPEPVREGARNVIFVALERVRGFLEEGRQYGIKTTNKDFTKNYNKIMGTELPVSECVTQAYNEVLEAVYNGVTAGEWVAPIEEEPEAPEETEGEEIAAA